MLCAVLRMLTQVCKCLQGTWADGMNIHGQHANVLVEGSTVQYSGDDSFATWSIGAAQTNVTFR